MKFKTVVQAAGSEPITEVHDLDLYPSTMVSARTWIQATIDEYNRNLKPEGKRLTLLEIEELPKLQKTGT